MKKLGLHLLLSSLLFLHQAALSSTTTNLGSLQITTADGSNEFVAGKTGAILNMTGTIGIGQAATDVINIEGSDITPGTNTGNTNIATVMSVDSTGKIVAGPLIMLGSAGNNRILCNTSGILEVVSETGDISLNSGSDGITLTGSDIAAPSGYNVMLGITPSASIITSNNFDNFIVGIKDETVPANSQAYFEVDNSSNGVDSYTGIGIDLNIANMDTSYTGAKIKLDAGANFDIVTVSKNITNPTTNPVALAIDINGELVSSNRADLFVFGDDTGRFIQVDNSASPAAEGIKIETNTLDILINSGADVTLTGATGISSTATTGGITATATAGDLALIATADNITATATAGDITSSAGGAITSTGGTGVTTTATTGNLALVADAADVTVTATLGAITSTAATGITSTATTGGITSTATAGGITTTATAGDLALVASADDVTVTATAGNIISTSGAALTSTGGTGVTTTATTGNLALVADAADVTVTATAGNITSTAATGITSMATTGGINFTATAGDLALLATADDVTVTAGAGSIKLVSTDITVPGTDDNSVSVIDENGYFGTSNAAKKYTFGDPSANTVNSVVVDNATTANGVKIVGPAIYLDGQGFAPTSGTNTLTIDQNGKVGILVSSETKKENITPLFLSDEALVQLQPVSYNYKEFPGKTDLGFIAERIAEIPEVASAVIYDQDGSPMSLDYKSIFVAVIANYQETKKALEAKLASLEEKMLLKDEELVALQERLAVLEGLCADLAQKLVGENA
jgi:hypothetical protein